MVSPKDLEGETGKVNNIHALKTIMEYVNSKQ